ncbi:putative UDP-N-acetylglucosamine--peptide N-acetylglucosaminyltransferase SEC [Phytophthora ramorum]|uniref:putative UDP-N-acetylglucosamine--peptide N-acetylglucosaminyltransferase SEC n=1 Tax=Phytophthora ramorum TaxID=164328 RepID=UPI0030A1000E|nr:putative UDP-N-acetylglucosamine--peptide N-acetylglucosaminyltransferase SEC [Phytophthora ramorum]
MYRPTFVSILTALVLLGLRPFVYVTALSIDELWQSADKLWQTDDLDSAMAILQQIETLQPGDRRVQLGIASIYRERKDFDPALEILHGVLAQDPHDHELLQRIGAVYSDKKDFPKALEYLRAAEREIDPTDVEQVDDLTHLFALVYHHGGDHATAEKLFHHVSERGRSAAFYFDFGVTLEKLGKILEAADAYNQALAIDPAQAQARVNIAALHHQFGDVNESIPQYLYVINLPSAPVNVKVMAMGNVGAAYEVSRDIVNALSWYERALEAISTSPDMVFPDAFTAQTSRMHLMVHKVRAKLSACVWANSEDEFDSLWNMVTNMQVKEGTVHPFTPFDSLLHALSPQERKTLAVQYSTKYRRNVVDSRNERFTSQIKARETHRLNIGYLSYDYADHPTTHLMEGLFVKADRSSMKIIAFGYGRDDSSTYRRRVVESVDKFVDLSAASFEESAQQIRNQQVHIVMDAQGHTRGGRMQIVAARPAPIVVNYLVFPGSSGAPFVDYVIVDKYVAPPAEMFSAFTEKLVVLPNAYQVNYYEQVLASSENISRRADLWKIGQREKELVKKTGFVFVNFNKIDKLEVSAFSTWIAILRRVPQSSLLLLDPGRHIPGKGADESVTSREIKKNLWGEALAQGISRRRIQFVERIPKAQHLQRHRLGGLFLDTFIYGAHSTATDALFAGLPVLTLAGDSFASRVGVSLLENLGMHSLITFSRKEYEDMAVYLATRPSVLKRLQRQLRSDKIETEEPLFRTKQHTQSLEASQRLMYDVYSLTNRTFHLVV